ncbi:MAG: hypothetical protein ACRENL_00540 [Candidatus Dormibacteria bacterium]
MGAVAAWWAWPAATWLLSILLIPLSVVAALAPTSVSLFVVPVAGLGWIVVAPGTLRGRVGSEEVNAGALG